MKKVQSVLIVILFGTLIVAVTLILRRFPLLAAILAAGPVAATLVGLAFTLILGYKTIRRKE